MRISDWSSDVCSSDLLLTRLGTEPKFSGAGLSRINERSDTRKGVLAMSQPYARFLHPFDVARHPDLEPEVKRAILASWASDRSAVRDKRSEERRVGKECVSTCNCRGSSYH